MLRMSPPLPGVADVDEPFAFGIPLPVEIIVPRREARERLLEERPCGLGVVGMPVDVQRGRGVHRGQDHAGGLAVAGRVRAAVGVPVPDPREVLAGQLRVEDNLR